MKTNKIISVLNYIIKYNENAKKEVNDAFFILLKTSEFPISHKLKQPINFLFFGGNLMDIIHFIYTEKSIYNWYKTYILPIIQKYNFVKKIQYAWRRHKLRDVRNFEFMTNVGKLQMASYAISNDARSICYLSHDLKMKISPFTWLIGIWKDSRNYFNLPDIMKNNEEVGTYIAKFCIKYKEFPYVNHIPIHIRKKIE